MEHSFERERKFYMRNALHLLGLGAAFLMLLPPTARGEGEAPETILGTLLGESLRSNRMLASRTSSVEGAEHESNAADRLPDPNISFGYSPVAVETRGGPQRARIAASQMFPFFGKRGLRKDVAGAEAARLGFFRDATAADILRSVKTVFWEIYRVDRSIAIADEEQALLGDILRAAEANYSTGAGDQANLFQVQLMQTGVENRIIKLRGMRDALVERLAAVVGTKSDVPPLETTATPLVSIDTSSVLEDAFKVNPDLAADEEMIRKARLALSLVRKDYSPDFSLAAGWAEIGNSDLPGDFNGRDSWSLGAMVSVPLYRGDIRDRESAQAARLRAAEEMRDDTRIRIAADIEGALRTIRSLEESIALYETGLIPQAESTYESAMAGYATGDVNFADLILAEKSLLDVELGYHESVSRYRQEVSSLERFVGFDTADAVYPPRAAR